MNSLIPVTQNENNELLVSARDLYKGLEVTDRFSRWFERMCEYGFEENIDYWGVKSSTQQNQYGGTKEIQDYALKIDMAKEISMIQRNEKGKQVRKYFIKIEKEYKDISTKNKYISEIDIAKAELSLVEVTAKLLNLNNSSKLLLATNVYENHNIPTNLLPQYTKSEGTLLPATTLLNNNNINISTQKFNKILLDHDILEVKERKSSKGKTKTFKQLLNLEYGENFINPQNNKEVQPLYYENKFRDLLKLVGLL